MTSTAPVEGLCSRMASAKLSSATSSLYVSFEDVSYQYWSSCCLNYEDQVFDGFYEVFGEFPEAVTSKDDFPVLQALHMVVPKLGARREVILFDSHTDPALRSIIEEARAALEAAGCSSNCHTLACHRQLSLVVAGRLGGPQPKIPDAAAPSLKHIEQLQTTSRSAVVPIGQVFIGAARHRALLYKYLSDMFGLKTRIMKGRFYANSDDDARVIVDVNNGEEYEIDLMIRPGTSSPLEKRLALRASSREVAGTDIFSRASSVGGSTAGTAGTTPASRSQSDAAHVDSMQAIAAAADAAVAATSNAAAASTAAPASAVPEPVATPPSPPEAPLPPSISDIPAATLEQAMQMAAAAAMGQDFSSANIGGGGSGSSGGGGAGPSPFANIDLIPPRESSAGLPSPPPSRFSFSGNPSTSSTMLTDSEPVPPRFSAPYQYARPSPYDNPSAQGWPGQPAGFGSPMPSQSIRSSAPYMQSGEVSELRLSMGPNVGARSAAAAAAAAVAAVDGSDGVLEEMGPAALISDASGQQYILQPVRASVDHSYMARPSLEHQQQASVTLTSRLSDPLMGAAAAGFGQQQQQQQQHPQHLRGGGGGGFGSISQAQNISAADVLKQQSNTSTTTSSNTNTGLGATTANRSLHSLAEDTPWDKTSMMDSSTGGPHRYGQPMQQHQYQQQQQQQQQQQYYYHPPTRSSLPEVGMLSSSLGSSGGMLASRPSLTGDAAAMQWAAMQAAGGGGPPNNGGGPFFTGHTQQNQQTQQQHTYNNQMYDSQNLDNMPYNDSVDVVSRLYLDSLRCNSVRMSVPIELEARQALLTRSHSKNKGGDTPAVGEPSKKPASRSSGDGVSFPPPELPPHSTMYTPFGAIDGALTGSGSDTLSPKSSNGTALSREASLKAQKNAVAAHAAAVIAASARAPSAAHSALPDLRDFRLRSASTISTLLSGGEGQYLASFDSRDLVDDGWEIDAEELQLGNRIGIGSYGEVYRGQWRQTDVAIKVFLDQELGARMLESFRKEVAIMKKLRHPNIVQFMGACSKPPNLCIVTQYVARGSLFKLLHRGADGNGGMALDERRRLQMALDVARGMNYLHTCRPPVIHRDLKSPNLLVEKDMTIKVCDFGLSRVRHATVLSAKSQAGTPEWTAPEVLQGKPCNEASDVYSFGVILWELQTGEEPWSDKSAMQVVGAVGFAHERLPIPEGMKPALADLMARCFGPSEDRPSFSEIISILKRQIATMVAAGAAAKSAAASASSHKSNSSSGGGSGGATDATH